MNVIKQAAWEELCELQLKRAKAGDAKAADWIAKHKPSVDTSRPPAGDAREIDALVARWKELLCLDCRLALLERIDAEQAAPVDADQRQAKAREHVRETYDLSEPPVENDPACRDADGQEPS